MENNMLITVLITIASVGILSTIGYLVSTVRSLKNKVETLFLEDGYLRTDINNQEANHAREHENFSHDLDVRFDKVHRKLSKNQDEVYQNLERFETKLPETIRKVIGHIEFARPLDKK